MQFIWLWIEDLIGKGLDWFIILKILFYAAAMLVPMALPLAVLLASVMTFGNLGEHFELTAMKSSGISLWRIMSPLIIFMIFLSIGAFYFSNNVLPYTNIRYATLLYDVSRKRPELNIKTGVFNTDIDGFSIKIEDKNQNTGMMYGFMIYDHLKQKGNKEVTVADSGEMSVTADNKNMVVTLYNGSNYTDLKEENKTKKEFPYRHDDFSKETIIFELPDLSMKKSDASLFEKHYEIMNTEQLSIAIDSLKHEYTNRVKSFKSRLKRNTYFKYERKYLNKKDSLKKAQDSIRRYAPPEKLYSLANLDSLYENMPTAKKLQVIDDAINSVKKTKQIIKNNNQSLTNRSKWLAKHELAWYKKFSLSFACLVFFFVGAPLGAIIRKGGFGLPILVSVVLFIIYYILYVTGEKSATENALPVFVGAWLSSGVLFPLGVFITYKATKDAKLINIQNIINLIDNVKDFLKSKRIFSNNN